MDIKIIHDNNKLILEKKSTIILILSLVVALTLASYVYLLNYYIHHNGRLIEYVGISVAPLIILLLCWYYYKSSSGSKKIVFDKLNRTITYNAKPLAYFKHVKSVFTRSDKENEIYLVIILFTNQKEIIAGRTKNINEANELQNKIQDILN